MSKVAKSKGKTRGKRWKDRKMCWGARQRIEIQLSKLRFEARAHYLMGSCSRWFFTVFVPRLVLTNREGNLVFNIMYGKFWFDGDFFVPEIWTPVRSSASTSPFHKKSPFLLLLTEWYFLSSLSLFFIIFIFFYLRLSSAFNFSMSKDFSISRDATCEFYTNKRKIHFSASEGWK